MPTSLHCRRALLGLAAVGFGALATLGAGGAGAQAKDDKPLEPTNGLTCLLVNKNSGRCLSVADGSANPGARIVQGPLPEQAGASERWTLLGAGKTFRLRNHKSRLVLEIGSANVAPGVQAIQWHDRPGPTHLLWTFEPHGDHFTLTVGHAPFVLSVQEGSQDAGARVIQWETIPDGPDQLWELRPAFQESYWSFKGNADKRGDFELIGPDADECVKFEAAGLRIALPLGHPDRRPSTGVAKSLELKGDFEITVGFEILGEPAPADTGRGTGFFLGVDLETERNRANFTRAVRERVLLTTWFELTKEDADRPFKTEVKYFPTTTRAGQLRLTRAAGELFYEVAAPTGSDFTLLHRHAFSEQDVKRIRIGAETGGPKASLDVQVIDLRIRAKSVPGGAALTVPGGALPDEAARSSRFWLVATVLLGVGLLLLVALAMGGLLVWRRRRTEAAPKNAAEAPSDPAAVSFTCPGCGKSLKTRGESAGKRLKCPKCGQAVLVP